jgi:hypothetical protein
MPGLSSRKRSTRTSCRPSLASTRENDRSSTPGATDLVVSAAGAGCDWVRTAAARDVTRVPVPTHFRRMNPEGYPARWPIDVTAHVTYHHVEGAPSYFFCFGAGGVQMHTFRRSAVVVASVIAAAGAALVAISGAPAPATTPATYSLPGFPADVGVLRMHLAGDGDYVRYDAKSGTTYTTGTPQSITESGCVVSSSPANLTITPSPSGGPSRGTVGLVSHSLGVQVRGEGNGTPCGQVNGTQSLELKLAGSLASYEMDYAELDIEGKFGVKVRADLYLGTTPTAGSPLFLATGGSDSGPDSADGDNYRWLVKPTTGSVFNRIVLSVDTSTPSGAFSLEGGNDGTAPHPGGLGATLGTSDSLFHITDVDGTLTCGASVSDGGTNLPTITVTLESTTGCTPVNYALTTVNDADLEAAAFEKLGGTSNHYRATIAWPAEEAVLPVPATNIVYPGGAAHAVLWCDGTPAAPVLPQGEMWCLTEQHTVAAGTDLMQITEKFYGEGDPGYWR